ncbi:hypothetical protein [Lacipirellula limnantheis]|uniref:Uncharacterized protein n=1 Tax=Lacipirellula limnantheis TaxID=2528024 RepID=A0A517U0R1_9BACT|nr:hypothetical protein [Lacipirellula limnantheis]QDT74216.1 hypothetical protein I41_34110 [Lacipirellula limnantheis]
MFASPIECGEARGKQLKKLRVRRRRSLPVVIWNRKRLRGTKQRKRLTGPILTIKALPLEAPIGFVVVYVGSAMKDSFRLDLQNSNADFCTHVAVAPVSCL